ncbi:MAG: pyrroline-5-carboxylate reductase [Opitutaceae bacterium]|nr:pyrroline-5-carboxylate reductase [Opitutaceae bacterium]
MTKNLNLHYAFIGAGSMAAAMIEGLISHSVCTPDEIGCLSKHGERAASLSEKHKIKLLQELENPLENATTIVLALKPQQLGDLNPALVKATKDKLIISILAGKKLSRLKESFPESRNIVRVMPNTPSQIGAGMSAYCSLAQLTTSDQQSVDHLLAAMGSHLEVDESQMDIVTAISGSGPAYVFEFIAALRDGGINGGLEDAVASKLALETVLGAARLLARENVTPESLRDKVTSPNGTTMAALQTLEKRDFRALIGEAVESARLRSIEISKEA